MKPARIPMRLVIFQSTLSLRRATAGPRAILLHTLYFNPRSPCGERLIRLLEADQGIDISIHALLAESDLGSRQRNGRLGNFNPRSPCGERPIHHIEVLTERYFNPRSPCGERRLSPPNTIRNGYFNPRSPCGERRGECHHCKSGICISIHALLAESDSKYHQIGPIVSV